MRLVLAFVCAALVGLAAASSGGAPLCMTDEAEMCDSMISTDILANTGDADFSTASSTLTNGIYTPGASYSFSLTGDTFKGFNVVSTTGTGIKVGAFTSGTNSQGNGNCGGGDTDVFYGVTHTDGDDKASATWTWVAPPAGTGTVMFYTTVVVNRSPGEWYFYAQEVNEFDCAAYAAGSACTAQASKGCLTCLGACVLADSCSDPIPFSPTYAVDYDLAAASGYVFSVPLPAETEFVPTVSGLGAATVIYADAKPGAGMVPTSCDESWDYDMCSTEVPTVGECLSVDWTYYFFVTTSSATTMTATYELTTENVGTCDTPSSICDNYMSCSTCLADTGCAYCDDPLGAMCLRNGFTCDGEFKLSCGTSGPTCDPDVEDCDTASASALTPAHVIAAFVSSVVALLRV